MMFYTSDKLTNVFECVIFVSQFHVHCKTGTLIHRITFDLISNANLYHMSAKTTRKLSRVFFSSLSTKDYFKDYVNKPVACINAIFIRFVVSYYGYRKKGADQKTSFKITKKNIQDMMKTISFSILFSTLQLFLNHYFSLFSSNLQPAKTSEQPAIAPVAGAF